MSKVVRVVNDDYKIIVDSDANGSITLDTSGDSGVIQGTTIVKGNLQVLGTTTTVESTDVTITDNTIILNNGESGAGVTLGTAGVQIDRGTSGSVSVLFDESSAYYFSGVSSTGAFTFVDNSGNFVPLSLSSINSDSALYITTPNSVIDVSGESNYEENVYTYTGGVIVDPGGSTAQSETYILNDDALTNAKAVNDIITFRLSGSSSSGISDADTSVTASDFDTNAVESKVVFTVDGTVIGNIFSNRSELYNIKIQDNQITTLNDDSTNQDLVLSASGAGSVRIDDALIITSFPFQAEDATLPNAAPPIEGVKLYSDSESAGGTGLYYINESSTNDELISKNKALLYSMLF